MSRPARSARRPLLASLLSAFLSTLLLASPVAAQQLQPIDRIVAVVDEDVILQSELARALANVQTQYAGREDQLPPRDVKKVEKRAEQRESVERQGRLLRAHRDPADGSPLTEDDDVGTAERREAIDVKASPVDRKDEAAKG